MPAQTSLVKPKMALQNFVEKFWDSHREVRICFPEIFPPFFHLRRALRFHSSNDVKEAMRDFFENQSQSFYSEDVDLLSKQYDMCYHSQDS
ncbi:hypothetical protein TNCV_986211 [Trichonephila clavipes]|uniref:Uncharacterized protein n=1 Tax=Trichonephila clavipes TaxID=2585209 RepID=A0A8X6VIC6_TRICX|nr:hypothetical protein TNCV_986211 [Trichonephila clavipes]